MFSTIPSLIALSFEGATGPIPPPEPILLEFNTSFYYVPTQEGETPLSTDFYYNPNID